jgi:hypothetical protein
MSIEALIPRHEGHEDSHYANVPYGYAVVLLSLMALSWISVANVFDSYFVKRLSRTLKPSKWVLIGIWTGSVCLFLFTGGSTESLSVFAKRVGRITFAMLPLTMFLSLSPSPLPSTYYVKLLGLHKWVARTVVLTGSIHGVCYLIYFIQKREVKKILHVDNFLGVLILTGFLTMLISSLRPLRQRNYKLFYAVHYPLAWVCLILGCFHARPNVSFLGLWCMFMLTGQIFYKIFTSRTVAMATVEDVSPSLYYVSLPRDTLPDYFPEGAHIRISRPLWSPWTWITPSHPYTVASLYSDGEVKLLIRQTRFRLDTRSLYSLTGPFSPTLSQDVVPSADKTLVFAGGSGISFAAPLVRALQLRGAQCKLVWIVREKSDLDVLDMLDINAANVYITGTNPSSGTYSDILGDRVHNNGETLKEVDDEIEFEELLNSDDDDDDDDMTPPVEGAEEDSASHKLKDSTPSSSEENIPGKIEIIYGRPQFSQAAGDFISEQDRGSTRVWAVACGPRLLVQDVEKWAKKERIQFTGEKYFL